MPSTPSSRNPVEAIRRLYYQAKSGTIADDLARAIELFKQLATEEERERAAVYMDGLSQMRSEWGAGRQADAPQTTARPRRPGAPSRRGKQEP